MDFQLSKMVDKRIVITGATGFIGTRLLERLPTEFKKRTLCLVRRDSNIKKIEWLGLKYAFCDLLEKDSLADVLSKDDIVLHIAGIADIDNKKMEQVNIGGMKNLLEAARIKGIKSMIYISSVNAKLKKGPYAMSKFRAEDLLRNSGIDCTIIRPTLVYDDYGNKEVRNLVNMVKRLKFFPVIGNGNYRLQPIHVDDLAELIILALKNRPKERLIEVGGSKAFSFNEIIGMISKNLNKKKYKVKVPKMIARFASIFIGKIISFDIETMDMDKVADDNYMEKTGIKMRDFEDDLKKIIKNLG